jgi:cold shock CspA family protein
MILTTGRVLQFDHIRGYGFVAADDGGEDVFLHASVFDDDPEKLSPGIRVEFNVMAGDRGRKAFAVRLASNENDEPAPVPQPRPVPAPPRPIVESTSQMSASQISSEPSEKSEPEEELLCDVLSPPEFSREFTELLISAAPELTGQQILQVRQSTLEFAKKHGWCDG